MKLNKLSLRVRIFFAMILLVLIASVLIAGVTIYQYNEEARDYHKERLERKEKAIISDINYVIRETTWPVETDKVPLIFKDEIYRIDAIHGLRVILYDLDGTLLKSSKASITKDSVESCVDVDVLNVITNGADHRYVVKNEKNGETFQSSYTYIYDIRSKPLAILNLPYLENDDFLNKELNEFLERL
jgi:two-component system nitrogen regulation sensor histidine kinase NtrY